MKKLIVMFTVICLLLSGISVYVSAYRELDYSCFEGEWEWAQNVGDNRYMLASAELRVLQCNGEYITFEFYGTAYHYVGKFHGTRVGIYDNSVSVKNDDGHNLKLTFSEKGIYFETDIKDKPCGYMERVGGFAPKSNEIDYARDINMCVSGQNLSRVIASVNGFDMLPILDVAGELGFTVVFNDYDYTLTNDIISYTFKNGDPAVTVSTGEWCGLDIVPQYIKGRFMIPAKFFTDVFGYSYVWDAVTDTVFLNSADEYNALIASRNAPADKSAYLGEWHAYSEDRLYCILTISEITDEYLVAKAEKASGKAVEYNIGKAVFIDDTTATATGMMTVPAYETYEPQDYKIELAGDKVYLYVDLLSSGPIEFTR